MSSILMFLNPLKISLSPLEDYVAAASAVVPPAILYAAPKKRCHPSFNFFSFEPRHNPWLAWCDPPGSHITWTKASKGLPLMLGDSSCKSPALRWKFQNVLGSGWCDSRRACMQAHLVYSSLTLLAAPVFPAEPNMEDTDPPEYLLLRERGNVGSQAGEWQRWRLGRRPGGRWCEWGPVEHWVPGLKSYQSGWG